MTPDDRIARLLERARRLDAAGQSAEAKATYLEMLRIDPGHFDALIELGNLALATGYRSAARTAYLQAVALHPDQPVAHVNLGNLYLQDGAYEEARAQYEAALATNGKFAEAHQGLARVFDEIGNAAAALRHRQQGFGGRALSTRRYRGTAQPVCVLLLVSTGFGNVATSDLLDDRVFEVTALYVDFFEEHAPLPAHAVVFNAIGDADRCGESLARAVHLLNRTTAPVINDPSLVARTGRVETARRFASLPDVMVPAVRLVARGALLADSPRKYPMLLRTPGFHMGRHFVRVEDHQALAGALASLPGDELLWIEYLDARGRDGMVRKYRVMVIDGVLYPLHLAVSQDWKVHYFSSAMQTESAYREEERAFLENMEGVLGPSAVAALTAIGATLALDYAGIDFGLSAHGSVMLFEANATMVIVPPAPDPMWNYRRPAIDRALDAARRLVQSRAGMQLSPS